jgi:uncharacterized membrane protein
MSNRTLTIAVIASLALNLFVVAAATTLWISRDNIEARVAEQRRPGRRVPMMAIAESFDPTVRDRVRQTMRDSALAARPDFEESRAARRSAVEMAGAETFDSAAVTALLDKSRAAELRGRQRLERDMITLLGSLDPDDRAALAPALTRSGSGGGGRGGRGERGPRGEGPPRP